MKKLEKLILFIAFLAFMKFSGNVIGQNHAGSVGLGGKVDYLVAINQAMPQLTVLFTLMTVYVAICVISIVKEQWSSAQLDNDQRNNIIENLMRSKGSFSDGYFAEGEGINNVGRDNVHTVFPEQVEQAIVIAMAVFCLTMLLLANQYALRQNQTSEIIELQSSDAEVVAAFRDQVLQANKTLPVMIDKETRFDRVEAVPGAKFLYHYTFVNYKSSEIAPEWLYSDLLTSVRLRACKDEGMKKIINAGGTFAFSYFGREGLLIGGFEINKQGCADKLAIKIERSIRLSLP